MKKGILMDARGESSWIGGLYYLKNIAFELLENKKISKEYNIYVYTYKENLDVFKSVEGLKIIIAPKKRTVFEKAFRILIAKLKNISFVFPSFNFDFNRFGIKAIAWVPDFQHNHLPEFFTEDEIKLRTNQNNSIANSKIPLVLSSNDCLKDFKTYYNSEKENVVVVPFVSYIESEIRNLTDEFEKETLKKYGISDSTYIYIANQFWQHKNHIVVLEAIKELAKRNTIDYYFVFTGKFSDYRNPSYIDSLKLLFEDPEIKDHVLNLGFVDRAEQIVIMRNAEYLIQPSLFEGWGTVVEDGKVLDKTILLSDIPVHREQKNDKCILFDPHDPLALAKLIEEENGKVHFDSIEEGIINMHTRALEYSKGFEMLLNV